jgi:hypothetical protein
MVYVRFEVFTTLTILLMFLWVKAPCGLVGSSQRVRVAWIEAARFSETSAAPNQ